MSQLAAFGLTVAVESLLYVGGLVAVVGLRWYRALALAVGVNICTHRLLWWVLGPKPTLTATLWCEAVVVLA